MKVVILITSFTCVIAEYLVPAVIDERGDWFVNVTIPFVNESMRIHIDMVDREHIPLQFRNRRLVYEPLRLLTGETAAHPFFSYTSRFRGELERSSHYRLGVHPRSAMVRAAESVALMRSVWDSHKGHLVIQSTFSSFNASCVPGSLMRRTFTDHISFIRDLRLYIGDSWGWVEDIQLWNGHSAIASLFTEDFDIIARYLVDSGAVRTVQPEIFSNCTREVIALVPPIELKQNNFGTLNIFSDEYIEVLPGDRCKILPRHLTSGFGHRNHVRLNPLKLQNLNIRISSNGIVEFCDTKYDDPLFSGEESSMESSVDPTLPV